MNFTNTIKKYQMTEIEKIRQILDGCIFTDKKRDFVFVSRPKDNLFDGVECWIFSGIEKKEPLGTLIFEGLTAVFKIEIFGAKNTFRAKSQSIEILNDEFVNLTKDEKKKARDRAAYQFINQNFQTNKSKLI